jgi:hypothetical protein
MAQKKHWYKEFEPQKQLLYGCIIALVIVLIDIIRWVASLIIRLLSLWMGMPTLDIEILSSIVSYVVAVLLLLRLIKRYSDRLEKQQNFGEED